MGFILGGLLLGVQSRISLFHVLTLDDLADLKVSLTGVQNADFVDQRAFLHATIRALDEAVFVDPRKAGQRRDEADIRTFRSFNRADAPVVCRVDVADLKSGALTRQPPRSEGGKTPLVRDFRERIRLIHELRKLAGAEEF